MVVETGDAIVGFLAFIDASDRPWIQPDVACGVDLYVKPEARAGLAAADLFRAARQLKSRYAWIWTNTHKGNRTMRTLLERAGFERMNDYQLEGLHDQLYYQLRMNVRN